MLAFIGRLRMETQMAHSDIHPAVNTTPSGIEMSCVNTQPILETLVKRRQGARLKHIR
jgi:hypothetical protein